MVIELKHVSGEEDKDPQCTPQKEVPYGGVVWEAEAPEMPKETHIALQNLFTDE